MPNFNKLLAKTQLFWILCSMTHLASTPMSLGVNSVNGQFEEKKPPMAHPMSKAWLPVSSGSKDDKRFATRCGKHVPCTGSLVQTIIGLRSAHFRHHENSNLAGKF
eukprot:scaffold7692_cov100-Cylindrotheca_fusiformis.AAC.1